MLPLPFKRYVPKIFRNDPKTDILSNKVDAHLTVWKNDVLGMKRLVRADECDPKYVAELGYLLRAGIKENDSDFIKRGKVVNAIPNHKKRGLWTNELKTIIDAVTGYSAVFYVESNRSDWIMVGQSYQGTDYVGSLGVNAVPDLNLGLHLYGTADEESQAGNIFINLHNGTTTAVLTYSQVKAVYAAINDYIQFAYLRLFIGYINGSGLFIKYDLMTVQEITASSNYPIFQFINGELWIIVGATAKVYEIETATLLHTINLTASIGVNWFTGSSAELIGNSLVILGQYWMTEVDVLNYTVIRSAYLHTSVYFTRGTSHLGGFAFSLDGGYTIHKIDYINGRKIKSWNFNTISSDPQAIITSDGYYLYLASNYDITGLSRIYKLDIDLNVVAVYNPVIHPSMFFWKDGKLYFGNSSGTSPLPQYGIFDPATETFEYKTIDNSVEFITFSITEDGEMFILRHYTTPKAILKYGKKFMRQRVSGETPTGVGTITNGYIAQLSTYRDFIAIATATNKCMILKNFSSIIGDPT